MRQRTSGSRDRVPLFGTWRKAYIAIVLAFISQVAIFYGFSRYFS